MKGNFKNIFAGTLASALFCSCVGAKDEQKYGIARQDVIAAMKKSADWHIANPYPDMPLRAWEMSSFYDGLIELSRVSSDAKYWGEVIRFGQSVGWTPYIRKYHADDHAVGHAWLETYRADPSKKYRLEPFKKRFDEIIEDAKDPKYAEKKGDNNPVNTWVWCDALYMAPPTLVRLWAITGDQKYLDYMNQEYKYCYETLWDKDDHLYYRDARFIGKKNDNGKKIFWGRGNGWVFGGLTMVLKELPKDNPSRKFYEDMFVQMAEAIAKAQMPDGLWGVNLADQDEKYSGGETSSSGFMVYGIAWGINNGYLDRGKYAPIAARGWKGLLTRVLESGKVGYVQPVGAAPDSFAKDLTQAYGIGVFLLAGSEIARMVSPESEAKDFDLVESGEKIFEKNKRAYAHIEPRRKDDIAWENDRMAFRAYGPALKDSIENSGIDVWFKLVNYPIIDKWYAQDFAGKKSYHTLSDEGADLFKVADTVGLGGTGIWHEGKLVKSNVAYYTDVIWATNDKLWIVMRYKYDVGGKKYSESKEVFLDYGAANCKVRTQFLNGHIVTSHLGWKNRVAKKESGLTASGLKVAVGLYPQTKEAKLVVDGSEISTKELFKGRMLDMNVALAGESKSEGFAETEVGETVLISALGEDGVLEYSFGYAWKEADGAKKKLTRLAPAKVENAPDGGFRGIWYGIPLRKVDDPGGYNYKYGGGLGTYPANHSPMAVYRKEVNKTFFVFGGVDEKGENLLHEISYFDHAAKTLARPVIITNRKTGDAHDNPVMNMDDAGYIYVFSPTHGTGARASAIFKSLRPYDISEFENTRAANMENGEKKEILNFSYPQVWRTKDGGWLKLFTNYNKALLPKGSRTIRGLFYATSPDGVSWSEWTNFACVQEGHYQSSGSFKGGEKIGTSFNYHPLGQKRGGLNSRTNLYFMQTLDGGTTWVNILGEKLALPLDQAQNPALVRDYEKEGLLVYIHDLQYDAKGNPAILYITSKGFEAGPKNDPRVWNYAKWNGKAWDYSVVAESDDNYDFGSIYISGETVRVIGSTIPGPQEYNTGGEIAMHVSRDGGKTWKMERQITKGSKYNHSYPRAPLNAHKDFYAFWADGNGREKSESNFYFCDAEGNAYRMPRKFDGASAKPEKF